jgi:hypothetical protein
MTDGADSRSQYSRARSRSPSRSRSRSPQRVVSAQHAIAPAAASARLMGDASTQQHSSAPAHSKEPPPRLQAEGGMQVPAMVDAVVQSPERSTDDLLAFYNKLISKARSLHEEDDSGPSEEDDDYEFQF